MSVCVFIRMHLCEIKQWVRAAGRTLGRCAGVEGRFVLRTPASFGRWEIGAHCSSIVGIPGSHLEWVGSVVREGA